MTPPPAESETRQPEELPFPEVLPQPRSADTFLQQLSIEHGGPEPDQVPSIADSLCSYRHSHRSSTPWLALVLITGVAIALYIVITHEMRLREQPSRIVGKYIPGLVAVDVHGNFTNRGFKLETDLNTEQSVWRCTEKTFDHMMMVEVFGEFPTRITLVRASYSNYSADDTDKGAAEFMSYAATIPYDGSEPKNAQSWVLQNIGRNATTSIGGVSFELICSAPRVRTLLIQPVSRRSHGD